MDTLIGSLSSSHKLLWHAFIKGKRNLSLSSNIILTRYYPIDSFLRPELKEQIGVEGVIVVPVSPILAFPFTWLSEGLVKFDEIRSLKIRVPSEVLLRLIN